MVSVARVGEETGRGHRYTADTPVSPTQWQTPQCESSVEDPGLPFTCCVTWGVRPPLSGLLFLPFCGMELGYGKGQRLSGLDMPWI